MDGKEPDHGQLAIAAAALRGGGLVAFPTETVYGLGANALMPEAVRNIFRAKGRPADNPLIVHVSEREAVEPLVTEVGDDARLLMAAFWPGPLTLLFNKSALVPDVVTAGLSTVAIRMPDHPVALGLIQLSGVPVAAPSANVSGTPSPTTFGATAADLDGKVDVILDGGPSDVGVESTIVDLSGEVPRVLRPGGVTVEELERVLGRPVLVADGPGSGPPPSPGMKYKHYAPRADVILASGSLEAQGSTLLFHATKAAFSGKKAAVICSSEMAPRLGRLEEAFPLRIAVMELGSRQDLGFVAARLFCALREADNRGADIIFAESFPENGIGLAIANRLGRASAGKKLEPVDRVSFRVLFVCSGNTCRSPMAAAMLPAIWERYGPRVALEVWSRGTGAIAGQEATTEAREAMAQRGIQMDDHRSQSVSFGDMDRADLVIAMTRAHKKTLCRDYPEHEAKVMTMEEASGGAVLGDVADPFGGGLAEYGCAAFQIELGLTAFAGELRKLLGEDGWEAGSMKIVLGADHAGFALKEEIVHMLRAQGHDVVDLGPEAGEAADYPDFAVKVADAIVSGEAQLGILVCGTGQGMAISANKVPGIRAVVASDPYSAKMGREHNDANMLCLGGRVVGMGLAAHIVGEFVGARFQGGRHNGRVAKIKQIEERYRGEGQWI